VNLDLENSRRNSRGPDELTGEQMALSREKITLARERMGKWKLVWEGVHRFLIIAAQKYFDCRGSPTTPKRT
jgi:hypothetical protein